MRISILLFLCSYSFLCFGQVFPQGEAEWVSVYQTYPCTSSLGYHLWDEKLTGDTLIDGLTYQKLSYEPLCIVEYQSKSCQHYEHYENASPINIGAIRQEDEKVYFYKFDVPDEIFTDYEYAVSLLDANQEVLLYDFAWATGDTVRVLSGFGVYRTYKVISDEIINGKKNITLETIFAIGANIKVIEGIGETRGIFGMYYFFTPNHDNLLESCLFQDGQILESHAQCNACGTVSTHDLITEPQLEIYPNPTSDELCLKAEDLDKQCVLKVFNSTGQQLFEDDKFHMDTPFSIQHLGLKGWLFLTLFDKNRHLHVGKVFVN